MMVDGEPDADGRHDGMSKRPTVKAKLYPKHNEEQSSNNLSSSTILHCVCHSSGID
jgi:hypothetical protein